MNQSKLSSTAKKMGTFFRVLQRIVGVTVIVVLCVLTVLTIANAMNPETVLGTELNVLEIGNIAIELKPEYAAENNSILGYAWCIGLIDVAWAICFWVGIGMVRKILAAMEAGQPFRKETGLQVKKLAVLSLVWGIVDNISAELEGYFALKTFGLDRLAESDMVQSVSLEHTLDGTFLVIFGLLLLLSYVFQYGEELQQRSDETL